MSMVYKRTGRTGYFVAVPVRKGLAVVWVKRATGTTHRPTALAIEAMLGVLGPRGQRAWDLLDPLGETTEDGTPRLTLGVLYDHYRAGSLDQLRAKLDDRDLAPLVAPWKAWVAANRSPKTAENYALAVRKLIPEGRPYLRSQATAPVLAAWVDARQVSGSTKRRYRAALQSFFGYCKRQGALATRPLDGVEAPRENRPRMRYLLEPDVVTLTDLFAEPYATLVALCYGAGVETAVALGLRAGNVNPLTREVFAPGTKTWCRERWVRVAEWAWPRVEAAIRDKRPEDPLFPGITAYMAAYRFRVTVAKTAFAGFQLRDGRHAWAVRAAKAGTPPAVIAAQLGHANPIMVLKVYGAFLPSQHDREAWEQKAATPAAAKPPVPPVVPVTPASNLTLSDGGAYGALN
ncbi:MAG: hypothetical protein IPK12_23665 [Gemmatimonadetes bacterium]|nr:hypothetical protein [Gemmatimonadota bacterium]